MARRKFLVTALAFSLGAALLPAGAAAMIVSNGFVADSPDPLALQATFAAHPYPYGYVRVRPYCGNCGVCDRADYVPQRHGVRHWHSAERCWGRS